MQLSQASTVLLRTTANKRQCVRTRSTPEPDSAMSAGVHIHRFDVPGALAAVQSKSFGCTMCGKCCTMEADAEVWVTSAEVEAMAGHLALTPQQFAAQHLQPDDRVPGWRMLGSQMVSAQQRQQLQLQQAEQAAGALQSGPVQLQEVCALLDPVTQTCSVYPVRPLQCSTYPWWPELMPAGHWQQEKVLMCEGLDHPDAPELDRWYAAQQLQRATDHALALEAAKPAAGWQPRHAAGSSGNAGGGGNHSRGGRDG